jgi:pimeloyl-[acyl-carrier protein] methyl ester esterase
MKLLFLHGWGLDARLWDGVRAALPEFETVAMDRGYFGPPMIDLPPEPFLAVGHSLGALMIAEFPDAIGHVAVNGFDRFVGEGAISPRVMDRMRKRFLETPVTVLAEFRERIGAGPTPEAPNYARLNCELQLLAEADARHVARPPTLVLHGGADPLLPPAMRDTVFAGAPRATLAEGGHLLPLTHPEWVAEHIRACAA